VDAVSTMSRSVPGSAEPVKAVSVISTGTVQIHPKQVYVTRQPMYWWLLAPRRWTPPRPIHVTVIEHARGLIVFGTGVGNRRRLAEGSRQVLALAEQQPGLVVLPAHDPAAARRLLDN
jgi:hypothetical protein